MSLAGASASDVVSSKSTGASVSDVVANAASKIMSAISGGATPPAPTSPATGTKLKIALATPELAAFRKRGKTTAANCGVGTSSKTDFNAARDKVVKEISLAAGFDGTKEISIAVTPNLKGVPNHRNVSEGDFEKSMNNVWDVCWQEGARGESPVQMYVFPHCCYSADAVSRLQG
jgi:hypothetical protein